MPVCKYVQVNVSWPLEIHVHVWACLWRPEVGVQPIPQWSLAPLKLELVTVPY